MTGLAGGLVETLREIGGALGVAIVATVLASRAGNVPRGANSAAHRLAAVNAFHSAFWVMFFVAALGALTAAIAFPRSTMQEVELDRSATREPTRSGTSRNASDESLRDDALARPRPVHADHVGGFPPRGGARIRPDR
jgi:hypothetical protein